MSGKLSVGNWLLHVLEITVVEAGHWYSQCKRVPENPSHCIVHIAASMFISLYLMIDFQYHRLHVTICSLLSVIKI